MTGASGRRVLLGGGLAAAATATLAGRADAAPPTAAWLCGGNVGIDETNYLGPRNVAALVFRTAATDGAPVERMRITPDGRVGIGLATPSGPLHVQAKSGIAVRGRLTNQNAGNVGVLGTSARGTGVRGESTDPTGMGTGVIGTGFDGVRGEGLNAGVSGTCVGETGVGVQGSAQTAGVGVFGTSPDGAGVSGRGSPGIRGVGLAGGQAGSFQGSVAIVGSLSKSSGTFKIDHPLDPTGKYLSHSFVESPDMKNIYDGVATLGADGTVEVALPAYFEALNTDFRYQLTCLGGFADVYVAREIEGNRFTIAGGTAGLRVSWQVTGVRKDAYARKHPVVVEEEKPPSERGRYLHPQAFGRSLDEGETMTRSQA